MLIDPVNHESNKTSKYNAHVGTAIVHVRTAALLIEESTTHGRTCIPSLDLAKLGLVLHRLLGQPLARLHTFPPVQEAVDALIDAGLMRRVGRIVLRASEVAGPRTAALGGRLQDARSADLLHRLGILEGQPRAGLVLLLLLDEGLAQLHAGVGLGRRSWSGGRGGIWCRSPSRLRHRRPRGAGGAGPVGLGQGLPHFVSGRGAALLAVHGGRDGNRRVKGAGITYPEGLEVLPNDRGLAGLEAGEPPLIGEAVHVRLGLAAVGVDARDGNVLIAGILEAVDVGNLQLQVGPIAALSDEIVALDVGVAVVPVALGRQFHSTVILQLSALAVHRRRGHQILLLSLGNLDRCTAEQLVVVFVEDFDKYSAATVAAVIVTASVPDSLEAGGGNIFRQLLLGCQLQ